MKEGVLASIMGKNGGGGDGGFVGGCGSYDVGCGVFFNNSGKAVLHGGI